MNCYLLTLFVMTVIGQESSHPAIYFIQPFEVRSQLTEINMTIADFGYIPYGHKLVGILERLEPPYACEPLDPRLRNQGNVQNMIAVVDRGECPFVRKAFHAEQAGYKMLLVIDQQSNKNVDSLRMISDHSLQVQIPTVMISKADGLKLLEVLKEFKYISVMTAFRVRFQTYSKISQRRQVDLQYYMSSLDDTSYKFVTQFDPIYSYISQSLNFTPNFIVYRSNQIQETSQPQVEVEDCIAGGKYCAPDPDDYGPLTGRDSIMEDIRQICIHMNFNTFWFKYASTFFQKCVQSLPDNIAKCSDQVMRSLNIPTERVYSCFNESFTDVNNIGLSENSIIREAFERYELLSVSLWPTLLINGIIFKGDLYFENQTKLKTGYYNVSNYASFEAICAGFEKESAPQVCDGRTSFLIKPDGSVEISQQHDSSILIWISVVISLVFVMAVTLCLYRRFLRKEMHQELDRHVRQELSYYYKLESSSNPL